MNGKVLTVSIAAYNVEKYLNQTLESMLIPELLDKLEVFIIDDGGTDNSLKIAQDYEKKYPDTFHAIHKEDDGYGSTVNYSILHSNGKYFKLLDGDDWFNRDSLIRIMNVLEESNEDIHVLDFFKGSDENDIIYIHAHNEKDGSILQVANYVAEIPIGMWPLIYKTDLLKKSALVLPENMFYVDQIYSTIPFAYAKTIRFSDIALYCYRIGRDGQSVSKESRIKNSSQMLKCCSMLCEFCSIKKDQKNENYFYILDRVARYYQTAVKTILLKPINMESLNELKSYEKNAKSEFRDVYLSASQIGKFGPALKLLRISNYILYWAILLIPGRIPNWN